MRFKAPPKPKAVGYPTEGLARVPDAAKFLSVGRDTVYRMIKDGQLESCTVRNAIRIPWSALHSLVKSAKKAVGSQK